MHAAPYTGPSCGTAEGWVRCALSMLTTYYLLLTTYYLLLTTYYLLLTTYYLLLTTLSMRRHA
jgi:hypothetical protein